MYAMQLHIEIGGFYVANFPNFQKEGHVPI